MLSIITQDFTKQKPVFKQLWTAKQNTQPYGTRRQYSIEF